MYHLKKNKDILLLNFENTLVKNVTEHKHLGLTFSSNLSWTNHINNILGSVSSMADILKKLKHEIDRKSLETIYFTFVRPKLEYACYIWDNCSQQDEILLEQFQLDMARIVTGARRGTSHELIYKETNWPTLKERRKLFKLKQFCKIESGEAPNYMQNLIPNMQDNHHNLRNNDNLRPPKTRTETFRKSFIPSAIRLWNALPILDRNIDFVCEKMKFQPIEHYNYGGRKFNIVHSQMRMLCSKLNAHLFLLHVIDSPRCPCGFNKEDNNHFLLQCPLYTIPRATMLQKISNINVNINCKLLLFGDNSLPADENMAIFEAVHNFIESTGRF